MMAQDTVTRPRRRRTHLLAAAAILVVIVAAGVMLEFMPGSGPQVTPTPAKTAVPADKPKEAASASVTPFGQAFARGVEAMRKGDAHTAARAFDEARANNPHIPEAHINLGFAFMAMERPREAAEAFDRALSIDPKKTNAYYGLGMALDAAGDREGAMGAMRSYVHLTGEDDPFRRKAMAALWEWQAAKEAKSKEKDGAGEKPKPEVAATKDATGGSAPEAASQQGSAGEKAKPEAVAAKDAAGGATPEAASQQGKAGEQAKSEVVAMKSARPQPPPPAPLPAIAEAPDALTPSEGVINIVNVWASWCGPCRAEMPSLQAFAAALDPKRYRLVGLNIDKDREFAREFIRDIGVSFSNYWDGKGVFARERFQVEAYPQTLFLDSSGAVIGRVAGAREWSAESAESAVAEILAADRQK